MAKRLENKVAVVFGAGSVGEGWGNGKASAVQYARDGAVVVAIDINPEAAAATAELIKGEGGQASSYACDVTDQTQISKVVAQIAQAHGRIDILHNNVGAPIMGTLEELDYKTWQRALDINLSSVFFTCQQVVPIMVRNGGGAIVNISSIAAIRHTGYPYPAYYASKAALNQFTVSIALEYARKGVRANVIMPGMMDTPHIYQAISGQYVSKEKMVEQRSALCPMGRMGTGWDIAKAAAFLASDEAQYITGVCLPVDGGITCAI